MDFRHLDFDQNNVRSCGKDRTVSSMGAAAHGGIGLPQFALAAGYGPAASAPVALSSSTVFCALMTACSLAEAWTV
jgi:hypothetical protein